MSGVVTERLPDRPAERFAHLSRADVVVAHHLWRVAQAQGLGQWLPL